MEKTKWVAATFVATLLIVLALVAGLSRLPRTRPAVVSVVSGLAAMSQDVAAANAACARAQAEAAAKLAAAEKRATDAEVALAAARAGTSGGGSSAAADQTTITDLQQKLTAAQVLVTDLHQQLATLTAERDALKAGRSTTSVRSPCEVDTDGDACLESLRASAAAMLRLGQTGR